MARLTTNARNKLPAHQFALPESRQFPIPNLEHARYALQDMAHEPAQRQEEIRRAVTARYPQLKAE